MIHFRLSSLLCLADLQTDPILPEFLSVMTVAVVVILSAKLVFP